MIARITRAATVPLARMGFAVSALLVVVAAGAEPARAQAAGVEVEVDRQSMTMDDVLEATITMKGSFDQRTEPELDGFVISGQGSSQRIQIVNGKMSKEQVLNLELTPKRAGTLTIGSVQLLRGGQVVARSRPIQVLVHQVKAPPKVSPEDARNRQRKAGQHFFLHASAPRSRYYVGEPFPVSWELWFRRETSVQQAEVLDRPKLEGVLAEDLTPAGAEPRVVDRRLAGRAFRMVPQAVQMLTGLEAGEVLIDPMTVRIKAGDFFRQKRYTLRSEPFEIQIVPLPEAGRPETYRDGNIGTFSLQASLRDASGGEPARVTTSERMVLEAVVSGSGNLVGVKAPILEGAEVWDIQALPGGGEDIVQKDGSGMHGRRVWQWLLSAREPGALVTPRVVLSSFDPDKGSYRTLKAPGVALIVSGRPVSDVLATPVLGGEDIGPQISEHRVGGQPVGQLQGTPIFWALMVLPFGLWLGIEGRHLQQRLASRDRVGRRSRSAMGNARKRIKLAEETARGGLVKDFYGQVSRVLLAYLDERANLPASGMTHDELRRGMAEAGYPDALIDALVVELENADFARFAPSAAADERMREALDRVGALVKQLHAIDPEHRP